MVARPDLDVGKYCGRVSEGSTWVNHDCGLQLANLQPSLGSDILHLVSCLYDSKQNHLSKRLYLQGDLKMPLAAKFMVTLGILMTRTHTMSACSDLAHRTRRR